MKNQASILKIAAVIVAIPRFAGAFALSAGFIAEGTVHVYLGILEVGAGISMAVLEGFAIAFILGKWRLLKTSSVEWYGLLIVILLLALSLPLVAVPYLYFMQTGFGAIGDIFSSVWVQLGWTFVAASISMLVVIGVGLADVNELERETERLDYELETKKKQANLAMEISQLELVVERAKVASDLEIRQLRATYRVQSSSIETKANEGVSMDFVCEYCGQGYETVRGLNGHLGQCKVRKNGQEAIKEEVKIGE